MAKYTVELNDIVKSGLKIFDFDYDFYDPEKKADFENKFINHFRFSEIGVETVGRFQHYLKCKCDETLPYYNMLLRTSLVDYEHLINYYLTETLTKDNTKVNDLTGNVIVNGSALDEKTSNLDSESDHTENITESKNETLTESNTINKSTIVDVDNKKVGSDTPNGLLALEDIKTNVYASKADIEDSLSTTTDAQTAAASKINDLTNTTDRTSKDTVAATSKDTNDSNFNNTSNSTQNAIETANENYTKIVSGNVGVRSDAEMLEHHIKLQKTFTTIYMKFFEECNDLFMQIY